MRLDYICKRLLVEVCAEKDIECYEICVNQEDYKLTRNRINYDESKYNDEEDAEYVEFLSSQISSLAEVGSNALNEISDEIKRSKVDTKKFFIAFQAVEDFLVNAYFLKKIMNQIASKNEGGWINVERQNDIIKMINSMNAFLLVIKTYNKDVKDTIIILGMKKEILYGDMLRLSQKIENIDEICERIQATGWSEIFFDTRDQNRILEQKYKDLEQENNFIRYLRENDLNMDDKLMIDDILRTNSPRKVLDIGIGAGYFMRRIAPLCESYLGISEFKIILEKTEEQMSAFDNCELKETNIDQILLSQAGFDFIYLNTLFYNITDMVKTIANLKKLLISSGIIMIVWDGKTVEYEDISSESGMSNYIDNIFQAFDFKILDKRNIEKYLIMVGQRCSNE